MAFPEIDPTLEAVPAAEEEARLPVVEEVRANATEAVEVVVKVEPGVREVRPSEKDEEVGWSAEVVVEPGLAEWRRQELRR